MTASPLPVLRPPLNLGHEDEALLAARIAAPARGLP